MHFCLTGGQAHDSPQAKALLRGIRTRRVIADKAYDSNAIREEIASMGAEPVIPCQSRRKVQLDYDQENYKNRNRVERFFNRLKQFRRIATRYEKLSDRYAAFVLIFAAVIWGWM